jgi:drug/metabolite transporter (DMT)-like permease
MALAARDAFGDAAHVSRSRRVSNLHAAWQAFAHNPPMAQPPSALLGIITIVLTLAGWSSVPLFLRHFAEQIDGWTSNGWRYGFSALVWLPVLVVAMIRNRLPRGLWRSAIIPSIVNAAGQVCFTWAHYRIDPGLLTFGLRSQLLFVAIGAWIMFPRERAVIRTPGYLLGAGLLIIGIVAVLATDAGHSGAAPAASQATSTGATWGTFAAHIEGVLLAVGSGLLFACYGLAVRKYMDGMNPVIAFAAICQYTAAAMVILMVMFGQRSGLSVLGMSRDQITWLLISALIGIAIGHVFYYISIARLGVAVSAGVLQLQPFIVAVISMAMFGETLGAWQWAGGCVAVAGAMIMLAVQWRLSRSNRRIEAPLEIAEGESGA